MYFLFNLLRIKGLYMFRALLAHPQEALHKRLLVYFAYNVSWLWHGCKLTSYARSIPNAVCVAPPEYEQVMLETCRSFWFSINWMKIASRWFHYTNTFTVSCRMLVLVGVISTGCAGPWGQNPTTLSWNVRYRLSSDAASILIWMEISFNKFAINLKYKIRQFDK
jgi:hypothetical protein